MKTNRFRLVFCFSSNVLLSLWKLKEMTIYFDYDKNQVIKGLRYHFLTRREIKILIIMVNVFSIASAILFFMKKIQPISFLIFSLLWLVLMLVIWRIMPARIYKKAATFRDKFSMTLLKDGVELANDRMSRKWEWQDFSHYIESEYFFHLYFDQRSFFLVPKDGMKDIPTTQLFRDAFRDSIAKNNK